jgi:hypothetical protein
LQGSGTVSMTFLSLLQMLVQSSQQMFAQEPREKRRRLDHSAHAHANTAPVQQGKQFADKEPLGRILGDFLAAVQVRGQFCKKL